MSKPYEAKARIDEALRNDLERIATERFQGNMSFLVREACMMLRDYYLPDPRDRRQKEENDGK